jgi:hypothetical protein
MECRRGEVTMNETVKSIINLRELLQKEGMDPEDYFPECVGCGYCCMQSTCLLGVELFSGKYPCKLADGCEDVLYIGSGCCSPLNSWRKDVKERRRL